MSAMDVVLLALCFGVIAASIGFVLMGRKKTNDSRDAAILYVELLEAIQKMPLNKWIGTIKLALANTNYYVVERRSSETNGQITYASLVICRPNPYVRVYYKAELISSNNLNARSQEAPDVTGIIEVANTITSTEVQNLVRQINAATATTN